MAASIGQIFIEIGARSDRLRSDVKSALDHTDKAMKRAGASIATAGAGLTAGITAPLTALAAGSVRVAAGFEESMNSVGALTGLAGDTSREAAEQLEALNKQAQMLGATTRFSAREAADGMGFLAQAGFKASEIIETMPAALDLAAASGSDLARTADILSNVMGGFGIATEESGRAADVMADLMRSANTDLEQLSLAMRDSGPVAHALGLEFEETAAAVGILGNAGIQASKAGTTLKTGLANLAAPTKGMETVLKALGVETLRADGKLRGLAEILTDLKGAGITAQQTLKLFGKEAGAGFQVLIEAGGDAVAELAAQLEDSMGSAADIAKEKMRGLNGALLEMKSAGEAVAIAIANSGIIQFSTGLAKKAAELLQKLSQSNPALIKMGVVLAGIAAAIGPVLLAVGGLVAGLGVLASAASAAIAALPVTAAVAGIATFWAGVAAAVAVNWDTIRRVYSEWVAENSELIQDIKGALGEAAGAFRDLVSAALPALKDMLDAIFSVFGTDAETAVKNLATAIAQFGLDATRAITRFVRDVIDKIPQAIKDFKNLMEVLRDVKDAIVTFGRVATTHIRGVLFVAEKLRDVFLDIKGILPSLGSVIRGAFGQASLPEIPDKYISKLERAEALHNKISKLDKLPSRNLSSDGFEIDIPFDLIGSDLQEKLRALQLPPKEVEVEATGLSEGLEASLGDTSFESLESDLTGKLERIKSGLDLGEIEVTGLGLSSEDFEAQMEAVKEDVGDFQSLLSDGLSLGDIEVGSLSLDQEGFIDQMDAARSEVSDLSSDLFPDDLVDEASFDGLSEAAGEAGETAKIKVLGALAPLPESVRGVSGEAGMELTEGLIGPLSQLEQSAGETGRAASKALAEGMASESPGKELSDRLAKDLEDIDKLSRDYGRQIGEGISGAISGSIADTLRQGEFDLADLAGSLADVFAGAFQRQLEDSLSDMFDQGIPGVSGSSGGNFLSDIFGGIGGFVSKGLDLLKGLPSFDAGGFTGRESGPGIDGKGGFLAKLHPNEFVLPARFVDKINAAPQAAPSVTVNQNFESGVTRESLAQILPAWRDETVNAVLEGVSAGGSFRRSMQS